MEILYLLIPISLIIIALAVGIFFWAVKSGQYDDLEGPAWRILYDDESDLRGGEGEAPAASEDLPEDARDLPREPSRRLE